MRSRTFSHHLVVGVVGVLLTIWSVVQALPDTATRATAATATDPARLSSVTNLVTVVKVTARTCKGTEAGSGFAVGDDLVVTAGHVVEGASTVTVELDGRALEGTVLGADGTGRDVAVVRVRGLGASGAPVDTRPLAGGAPVAAAGHPQGGPRQALAGAVVGYVDDGPLAADGGRVLTVSIAFAPGMSGGPVVDPEGRVVGVAIGVERNSGTGIAVPATEIGATLHGEGLVASRCGDGG